MKQQFRCVECKHFIELISVEKIENLETYCKDCLDKRVFKPQASELPLKGGKSETVCQDCKEPLLVDDDSEERTDLRCPECWAKMEKEMNLDGE